MREVIKGLYKLHPAIGRMQVDFKKYGRFGLELTDWWSHVGERFDDVALVRSMSPNGDDDGAPLRFLDKDLKDLGSLGAPSSTTTTAYNSQPILYPAVDGRVVVRGDDGIYGCDRRRAAS